MADCSTNVCEFKMKTQGLSPSHQKKFPHQKRNVVVNYDEEGADECVLAYSSSVNIENMTTKKIIT